MNVVLPLNSHQQRSRTTRRRQAKNPSSRRSSKRRRRLTAELLDARLVLAAEIEAPIRVSDFMWRESAADFNSVPAVQSNESFAVVADNQMVSFDPATRVETVGPVPDEIKSLLGDVSFVAGDDGLLGAGLPSPDGSLDVVEAENPETTSKDSFVFGTDGRTRIGNTTSDPWRRIGRLWMRFGSGSGSCSGALIDDYHVLTAGHCVHDGNGGDWADEITFSAGQDDQRIGTSFQRSEYQPYGQAKAVNYRSFTGWTVNGNFDWDVALLTLDRNIGDFTGHLGYGYTTNDSFYSGTAHTSGYPGDLTPNEFDQYYNSGNARNHSILTHQLRTTDIDTYAGQSGSSLYYIGTDRISHGVLSHFSYSDTNGDGNHDPGEPAFYNSFTRLTESKFNSIGSWRSSDTRPTDKPELVDWDTWFNADLSRTDSSSYSIGESISATAYVRNNGTASTGVAPKVRFRLSTDRNYDSSDIFLGDATASGAINPFAYRSVTLNTTVPEISQGNYYVVYTIDPSNDIAEFSSTWHRGHVSSRISVSAPSDGNDEISEATTLTFGSPLTGFSISNPYDVDMFRFTATSGDRVLIDVDRAVGSGLDAYLRLFQSNGVELSESDDRVGPAPERSSDEPYITYTIPSSGVYFVGVSGYNNANYSPTTGSGDIAGDTGEFVITINRERVYIVNSLADQPDASPGDGVADTGNYTTTLRSAIEEANATNLPSQIRFDIPGTSAHVIRPQSPLPELTSPVTIDGSTDDSWGGTVPAITIDGTNAGAANGFKITGGNATLRWLVINNFRRAGIDIAGTGSSRVEHSRIGTSASGQVARPNGGQGIKISSPSNTVQETLISGNTGTGITIFGNAASNNLIDRVVIGVNSSQNTPVPNGSSGVVISNAPNNTIVDSVLSGNTGSGVVLVGSGSSGNQLSRNWIGTNNTGTRSLGNRDNGIQISSGANNNTIGLTRQGDGNVIGNNYDHGVLIVGSGSVANRIMGNYVGTNPQSANLANLKTGLSIQSRRNIIGGGSSSTGNVIGFNGTHGVWIAGSGSYENKLRNNYIGTSLSGGNIGNKSNGIVINGGADRTIVGSTQSTPNRIAFNKAAGIRVGTGSTGTRIVKNSIHSNVGLAIDLGATGYQADDNGDADNGANRLQNAPVIQSVDKSGNDLVVTYKVRSETRFSAYPLAIEFFVDGGGREGEQYIAANLYTENHFARGWRTVVYSGKAAGFVPGVTRIVATATDSNGNTSEFSGTRILGSASASLTSVANAIKVDTNEDDHVSAADALRVINTIQSEIYASFSGASSADSEFVPGDFPDDEESPIGLGSERRQAMDVNGDGLVTAMDALVIMNYLASERESSVLTLIEQRLPQVGIATDQALLELDKEQDLDSTLLF